MPSFALYFGGHARFVHKEIKSLSCLANSGFKFADSYSLQQCDQLPGKDQMLKILYYKDAQGAWYYGLDATVMAWSHTSLGFLFKLFRLPIIKQIADKIYLHWADKRYCNTYSQCNINN